MRLTTEDRIYAITRQIAPPTEQDKTLIISEQSLYVFFSIDICDSTKLKADVKNWFDANFMLYNVLFESMHFWKYNGDEVLYAEQFSNLETLIDIVEKAYVYMKHLQNELCNKFGKSFRLKGTIWLAEIGKDFNSSTCYHVKPNNSGDEFVGTSIDEGFRLAKKITGSKIVIDPKIIYYFLVVSSIYNNKKDYSWFEEDGKFFRYAREIPSSINDKLENLISFVRFVGFTKLKGIWNNRMYPVFWYYQSDKDNEYDEELDNIHVCPTKIKDPQQSARECYKPETLENVFNAVNISTDLKRMLNNIAEGNYAYSYTLNTQATLYYSIACVNPESNRILIAKRSSQRMHLKGVWEFIPFKHRSMEIVSTIKTEFKTLFGMDINIITDGELEQNIIPLHFCTTYRNGVGHNNLLCVAFFEGARSDEEILKSLREKVDTKVYEDFAFVDISDSAKYKSLTRKEIENDSLKALSNSNSIYCDNTATMYFAKTICAVRSFWDFFKSGKNWYDYGGRGEIVDV